MFDTILGEGSANLVLINDGIGSRCCFAEAFTIAIPRAGGAASAVLDDALAVGIREPLNLLTIVPTYEDDEYDNDFQD